MNEYLEILAGASSQERPHLRLKTLAEFERDYIETVLKLSDDSIPEAAKTLDISPSTLYRKKAAWKE